MTPTASVVADSQTPAGARLTTLVLTYPRFVHAEFLTHRALSRNASSSRAMPVRRMVAGVLGAMVRPSHVGRAQAGMQAGEELAGWRRRAALLVWSATGLAAAAGTWGLGRLGVHKQVANRMLEPWSAITVVCTATCFDNFFALRCHRMAQPEIRLLAEAMRAARAASTPRQLPWGGWHLPFVGRDEQQALPLASALAASVARCARVSYCNHDGSAPRIERDLALFARLMGEQPPHASPAEHQGLADPALSAGQGAANFRGWRQYRGLLEAEQAAPAPRAAG